LLERRHRHARLRLFRLVRTAVDGRRDRLFLRDLLGHAGHVVAREVSVDRLRGELPLRDGLAARTRAHLDIASREHAGAVGHERAIRDDGLALGLANSLLALEEIEIRDLANGGDRRVALDDEVRAFDRDGAPPARRVRLAESHTLELDAADAAVLLDEPDRRGKELEADALVLGVVDLAGVRAHF